MSDAEGRRVHTLHPDASQRTSSRHHSTIKWAEAQNEGKFSHAKGNATHHISLESPRRDVGQQSEGAKQQRRHGTQRGAGPAPGCGGERPPVVEGEIWGVHDLAPGFEQCWGRNQKEGRQASRSR